MNFLRPALLSIAVFHGDAFLPSPPSRRLLAAQKKSTSQRHGIREWRRRSTSADPPPTIVPTDLPVLPFPFPDLLLPGQRTQLNLFEQRFHELFQEAVDNHAGMVGMGLLAGRGMVTTLPLCEVESFTRFGADDEWVARGDGLGNGSIIVTIRAVGRAKIVEELVQEEPYMKARVVEIFDEDVAALDVQDKHGGVEEVVCPSAAATLAAGDIENLLVSLSSMERKLREIESGREQQIPGGGDDEGGEAMDRRLVNARLESLFTKDSTEGVGISPARGETTNDKDEDDADEGEDEAIDGETDDEALDRTAQYQKAFKFAKEADTFGYILRPVEATDELPKTRTPQDLTAISWAAFCTGPADNIQRDVVKIQALDMVDVVQRLQLAVAMLGEERKKLQAKLALVGIKKIMDEEL